LPENLFQSHTIVTLSFFHLGFADGGVVGFQVAVASMRKGERSYFIFKPQYFYGEMGCKPRIPENCTGIDGAVDGY
jgi:FKBP-type peptidyl-prolyl cis-trans isomerase